MDLTDLPPKLSASRDIFTINPDAVVSHHSVGHGGHRVVVVDDLYENFDDLRALATKLQYSRDPEITFDFPGERAVVDVDIRFIGELVANWYGKECPPQNRSLPLFVSRSHSTDPLSPSQRQPHTDPALSAFVYLNDASTCAGGTALYRHRATGIEWLPFCLTPQVADVAQAFGYPLDQLKGSDAFSAFNRRVFFNPAFAAPEGELINEGSKAWELMEVVEMRPNRLLIFDGRIPHSMYGGRDDYVDCTRNYQLVSVAVDYPDRPTHGTV